MPAPHRPTAHSMTRRASFRDYSAPGIYHITLTVTDGLGPVLGSVTGDLSQPEGSPEAPRVELTAVGQMVEQQLTQAIPAHYPMVEIQDHVVMPDHLHAIIEVHGSLFNAGGRHTHLGQVIAGFKKGCNHGYWQIIGQTPEWGMPHVPAAQQGTAAMQQGTAAMQQGTAAMQQGTAAMQQGTVAMQQGKPAAANAANATNATAAAAVTSAAGVSAGRFSRPSFKVPSDASTLRTPLWNPGYCDVQPLRAGQLATQRAYIRANPRSRLLRMSNRAWLTAQRGAIDTRLTPAALRGYLARECSAADLLSLRLDPLMARLMLGPDGTIACDSYGDRSLLERRLLPVVCHRKDKARRAEQLQRCFAAADEGAVLVSARIAPDEQAIVDAATEAGFPVVRVIPDGMSDRYHPSAELTTLCAAGLMLIVTPWHYRQRPADGLVTVGECKTMNCVVQALCRLKDEWWKDE